MTTSTRPVEWRGSSTWFIGVRTPTGPAIVMTRRRGRRRLDDPAVAAERDLAADRRRARTARGRRQGGRPADGRRRGQRRCPAAIVSSSCGGIGRSAAMTTRGCVLVAPDGLHPRGEERRLDLPRRALQTDCAERSAMNQGVATARSRPRSAITMRSSIMREPPGPPRHTRPDASARSKSESRAGAAADCQILMSQ